MVPIEYIVKVIAAADIPKTASPPNQDTWEKVGITAIALGLAPLLHWRLEQASITIPPMVMAKLAITRKAHARRNADIARQLGQVLAACARQQLDVLVLKGAFLAPKVYPEAALRPMNDIDLLFRPQDLGRVGSLLEQLGYQGKYKAAERGPGITKHLSTYRRPGSEGATPNPYLSTGGDRMIEPHGSLEESWFGLKVDITPGAWERAVPISLHGQPAYRLCMADMVLHLAVHAVFHVIMGTAVFVQLYDIDRLLKSRANELDWPQLLALAEQSGASPFLYAGLYWARNLYQAPVPKAQLVQLAQAAPPRLRSHIQALGAVELFKQTQRPPLVTLGHRLRRGLADRHEAARWAGSWQAKWRVWQTALAFYKTDTAHLFWRLKDKLKAPA